MNAPFSDNIVVGSFPLINTEVVKFWIFVTVENTELSKIVNDCCQELLQWDLIPYIFRQFILLEK